MLFLTLPLQISKPESGAMKWANQENPGAENRLVPWRDEQTLEVEATWMLGAVSSVLAQCLAPSEWRLSEQKHKCSKK